jgi:DNA uptake protein ComE-like DNA-binding protein
MATWGAEATAEELTQIRRFLTRTRGLVAVNSAPAAEFAAVLGLPIEVANSVVAYRTTLTRFPDLEALLRVPGLERSPIEQSVQALRFD